MLLHRCRRGCRADLAFEVLEDRTLLSTILWTNRGSPLSDTDSFNAVFGARAALARSVVDAALLSWQNVIQNFNFADGTNTMHLTIAMDPTDHTNDAASWYDLATDGQGRPESGLIHLGAGADGFGAGWYLDPNPLDSTKFHGAVLNPYSRESLPGDAAYGLGDLFSIVLHETTHTLGINPDPRGAFQQNIQGYLRDTGVSDAVDTPGTLFTFTGPHVQALFTSDDGESTDTGRALHRSRAGSVYTDPGTGITYAGAVDLMNPIYAWGRRTLISQTDALILEDAYGYTIASPRTITASEISAHVAVTGADAGAEPTVSVFNASSGSMESSFLAYDPRFLGGVRVATGDINGDGIPDIITAPGPGGGPDIRVYDGASGRVLFEFMAYAPVFTGGVFVAVGDVNGDGFADIITGADAGGGPHVEVFSGRDGSLIRSFYAYSPAFTGGVRVAAGDVDGDGKADIITGPGPGGGPHLEVFSGASGGLIRSAMVYAPAFTGGIYVAAGDVNGDHKADIITGPGTGCLPIVQVYNGADGALLHSFLAYDPSFTGGVRVSAADVNGNGLADVLTAAGPGGGPLVRGYDGMTLALIDNFFAYDPYFSGGVFVGGN